MLELTSFQNRSVYFNRVFWLFVEYADGDNLLYRPQISFLSIRDITIILTLGFDANM